MSRTERRRQRRRRRRRIAAVAGAVVVVAVLGVGAAVVLGRSGDGRASAHGSGIPAGPTLPAGSGDGAAFADPSAAAAVLAAARTGVTVVDSYDYRTLDANRAAGLAVTTGAFRSTYEQSMTGSVGASAAAGHVVQTCTVQQVGLAAMSGGAAAVLVFAVIVVGGPAGSASSTATPLTLNVTMHLVGQDWLIAAMGDVGSEPEQVAGPPGTAELTAAVAAGQQATVDLVSYRRAEFATDFARSLNVLAPDARAQQEANRASLLAAMRSGSFDYVGTVVETAVEDAGFDAVTLLGSGQRYQQAGDGTRTSIPGIRAEVAMSRLNGHWLVDQFSTIGTATG